MAMSIEPVGQDPAAQARNHINDAFLEEWEKRLQLQSPHQVFRQTLLTAVTHHLFVPPGGLASVSRRGLNDAKKYWSDLHTCFSCLLKLLPLPHESFKEHPQAWLMRIEVIGKAPDEEQAIRARELFEERAVLEKWMNIAEAQMEELSKQPVAPNAKLIVSLLVTLLGFFGR
jgi:hypothetical protein